MFILFEHVWEGNVIWVQFRIGSRLLLLAGLMGNELSILQYCLILNAMFEGL